MISYSSSVNPFIFHNKSFCAATLNYVRRLVVMASPVLESFCCMPFLNSTECTTASNQTNHANQTANTFDHVQITYNALCIASSAMSICGALYQLTPRLPRYPAAGSRQLDSMLRQNSIICWLAIADLLASIGVLVRSALWIKGYLPSVLDTDFSRIFCAVSSAWIQFFYVCTYFWTFIYAVDILRLTQKKPCLTVVYHAVCWGVSTVISTAGLIPLYLHHLRDCTVDRRVLVPHYLSTYIPMVLVMIANPILYYRTSKIVKQHFYNSSTYTRTERAFVEAANSRFRSFIAVFYVCWFPNIINSLLLFIKTRPIELDLVMWHTLAVLNPLQAFLNSIVYRGVGLCYRRVMLRNYVHEEDDDFSRLAEGSTPRFPGTNSDETSPLLRSFSRP